MNVSSYTPLYITHSPTSPKPTTLVGVKSEFPNLSDLKWAQYVKEPCDNFSYELALLVNNSYVYFTSVVMYNASNIVGPVW